MLLSLGNNAVVVQVSNHRQVQYPLLGVNIGNISHPFAVGCFCMEIPVQKVLVLVELLSHLSPFSGTPNLRKQAIFLHDPQDGFGVVVDTLPF